MGNLLDQLVSYMGSNKGKKLKPCKECGRKRFCSSKQLNKDWREISCSRGHAWREEIVTIDKINASIMTYLIPSIREMYDAPNPLLEYLKG